MQFQYLFKNHFVKIYVKNINLDIQYKTTIINNIFIKKNGEKFRDFILQDIKELYDSFLIFHMVFVFYKYI